MSPGRKRPRLKHVKINGKGANYNRGNDADRSGNPFNSEDKKT